MSNLLLEKKDKEITLKYLLNDKSFFQVNKAVDFGFTDWNIYRESFKNRNGCTLEAILKSLKDNGIESINEYDVDELFQVMKLFNVGKSLFNLAEVNNTEKQVVKKKISEMQIVKNFQGLVTGIVLEPETLDLQKQIISKEEIAKAYYHNKLNYNQFDIQHNLQVLKSDKGEDRQIALVQSFLAPQDLTYGERIVKEGTWIEEVHIFDQTIKKMVEEGKLTGFSIFGWSEIESITA